MSLSDNTSVRARTLAAFFDSRGAADKAVADLEAAGLPRQNISMIEGRSSAAAGTTSASPEPEGFWQSLRDLFMPEEDRYTYAEGLRRGGYLVSIRTENADLDRVLDILDRDGAVDMDQRESTWGQGGWTGYQGAASGAASTFGTRSEAGMRATPASAAAKPILNQQALRSEGVATGQEEVIPVYEERLQVGKREVSHGRMRVRSYVVETPVNEQISLRSENVQVDRRTVDRAVSATDAMFQDRVVEVEEFTEEAVVSKEARVIEEVSLRKESHDRTETVSDTVRRTEIDIEDERVSGPGTRETGGTRGVPEGSRGGRITANMDVIASDGAKVGTVDAMEGSDRIKLAKHTSPDGQHHFVPMSWVDHVDQHVHVKKTSAEIKAGW